MSSVQFVQRPNGSRIAWRKAGKASGSAILFSNSLAADMSMWQACAKWLADQHTLIFYDNRGHGQSTCPDQPSSLADLASDALAVLDAADVDKVWWVGISLGGMAGMQAALDHPQRLLGLMACNCRARIDQAGIDGWNQREALARAQGMAALAQPTLDRWFTADAQAAYPGVADEVLAMIARNTPEGFATCTHAIKTMALWDRLPEIRVPTHYLAGAQDGAAPPSEMHAMVERVPGSSGEVFDPCGHLSAVQRPQDFANVFMRWSKSVG